MQLCNWTVVLYRLLYGVVSTIVWICINYCMDLIRVLYGFVSTIIWIVMRCILRYIWIAYVIVYLIGVIYTLFIKKNTGWNAPPPLTWTFATAAAGPARHRMMDGLPRRVSGTGAEDVPYDVIPISILLRSVFLSGGTSYSDPHSHPLVCVF